MKITNIAIQNFRLLQDFSINLEDDISVVIGKNNTGKTSLLVALTKFLDPREIGKLSYDDISISERKGLLDLLNGTDSIEDEKILFTVGIQLTIMYDDKDDLSNVAKLITNLDPLDKKIVLTFGYELIGKCLNELRKKWSETKSAEVGTDEVFLRQNLIEALGKIKRRSKSTVDVGYDIDLDRDKISLEDVISFRFVSARRDVTNKDNDQTLSTQTARLYKLLSGDPASESSVEEFKAALRKADESFTVSYANIFKELIEKVHTFGGTSLGESTIKISSTLQHRDILTGNTTVMYQQDSCELPEHYNGLGYMNLISMIFEIDLIMKEFYKIREGVGAALNLLFIEEPEAHTHPQLQYIFVKNIRKMLADSGKNLTSLQTVLSTHSSHIIVESEFDSIKYLQRSEQKVQAKNLRGLESNFTTSSDKDCRWFRFLKQYLTLNRAELFFADKVVLVEGDTERILLPAMMRKLDQDGVPRNVAPLLSQNVSIVEVGAYSQVYEKLIEFLGLKTLIITDIDSGYVKVLADKSEQECPCCPDYNEAKFISNSALCFFHSKTEEDLDYFLSLDCQHKTCAKQSDGTWKQSDKASVFTAYQTKEEGYYGRSFEDAFFSLNKELLRLGHDRFSSLTKKWYDKYISNDIGPLEFAQKAVTSKPSLAIEILLNSDDDTSGKCYSNWKTPAYIRDGLMWLRGDFDA